MSRRSFVALFIFLLIIAPFFLAISLKQYSKAETLVNNSPRMIIDQDTIWKESGSPFIIEGDLIINKNIKLIIEPGVIVKLGQYASILVDGKIEAVGEPNKPIIFTSISDNAHGGYYCPSYGCSPYNYSYWGTIAAGSEGEVFFENVNMFYAGQSYSVAHNSKKDSLKGIFYPNIVKAAIMVPSEVGAVYNKGGIVSLNNLMISDSIVAIKSVSGKTTIRNLTISDNDTGIRIEGGELLVDNSKIINNNLIGIEIASGSLVVAGSTFSGNLEGAIINTSGNLIDAKNNWWGHNSGPYHANLNPTGLGNYIEGDVLFDPWIGKIAEVKQNPVIIVPGIISSYLNKNEPGSPEVWPNVIKMMLPGDDSYLNELSMNESGWPNSASLMIPKDIFRSMYGQDFFDGLIKELENNGYKENESLFVFPYDWRWDIDWVAGSSPYPLIKSLKDKVEEVKQKTGTDKVDIVAHSMGGLVAKQYINFYGSSSVDKFIDIGTPHLGAPKAFKILMYGDNLGFKIGKFSINETTVKNISQNFPSIFELLPSKKYFDSNEVNCSNFISDIYDYDGNGVKGKLDYSQSQVFMENAGFNKILLNQAEGFHDDLDNFNSSSYSLKTYNIVGCGRPTIGRIYILNKEKSGEWEYGLQYINGDSTVPLRSAEDLSGALKIYYANNTDHPYLASAKGVKELVGYILKNKADDFPLELYSNLRKDKNNCGLSGVQIEYHSPINLHVYDEEGNHIGPDEEGNIDLSIEGAAYDIIGNNKFVFLPSGLNYRVEGRATGIGTFNAKIKNIVDDEIVETFYFNEVPLVSTSTVVESTISAETFTNIYDTKIDQEGDGVFEEVIGPSSALNQLESSDYDKPQTDINVQGLLGNNDWYITDVRIELLSKDQGSSGVLKTEYSLDAGNTWQTYLEPFIINKQGENSLFYQTLDRAGNLENVNIKDIKIDDEEPTVNIIFPFDGQKILHSEQMDIFFDVLDDYSGIDFNQTVIKLDGQDLSTSTIDLFSYGLGGHSLKVGARDLAGNVSSSTIKFIVSANIDSTIADVSRSYQEKLIAKKFVYNSITQELISVRNIMLRFAETQKNEERLNKLSGKCANMKNEQLCKKIAERWYNTVNYRLNKITQKVIQIRLMVLLNEIKLYHKKNLINDRGFDIVGNDVMWVINDIKEGGDCK